MTPSSALGLLGFAAALLSSWGISGATPAPQPSCGAGESQSATCTEAALLRRRSPGIALIQHKGALSVTSVLRIDAARIAAHVRSHRAVPENLAASLKAGLEAFDAASKLWMASPPNVTGGITTLATKLLEAVEGMVPEDIKSTADFAEFRTEWMRVFRELPAMVESIEQDIRAFAREGATNKLIRAINTVLLEAGTVVSKLLPEETGDEVAKYLGAVVDVIDGVGEGIEAFEKGETSEAVEAMYKGMRAATRDLVPAAVQNDATYRAVVSVLDATVGNVSRHVLEYKQQLEQSEVCWKGFKSRDRKRPSECEEGYTWDGEQWCLYRQVSPHTIQSFRSGHYLNVWFGSRSDGADVKVWNNPDSKHSQWRIQQAPDGKYTIKNVNGGTYLHVKGSKENGANVEMSSDAASARSQWLLSPAGREGVYTIQSAWSGKYVNLEGGSKSLGANVKMWDNPGSVDTQWRIAEAWGGAPFRTQTPTQTPTQNPTQTPTQNPTQTPTPSSPYAPRPALLEHTVAGKQPRGALPARCDDDSEFAEKRGAWCYEGCPSGYEASGARCQVRCGTAYPSDSDLMCGKTSGAIAAATTRMIIETVRQTITIALLVEAMKSAGLDIATGLKGTMEALIELGKPFAHPNCPV